jgi:ABC-type Zn2+ transport system substrate-binding protein/surface adhesin
VGERSTEALDALVEAANVTYSGLINPTTGKPPISLTELKEARGEVDEDDDDHDHDHDHDPNDGEDHTGHNHD